MKKTLFLAALAIVLSACGKSEPSNNAEGTTTIKEGRYHGRKYSKETNTTYHEIITFKPYSSPKDLTLPLNSFKAEGTAEVESYQNDKKLYTDRECYYSLEGKDRLTFYAVTDGSEDKRIIRDITDNGFIMRKYGLTEENDIKYIKE